MEEGGNVLYFEIDVGQGSGRDCIVDVMEMKVKTDAYLLTDNLQDGSEFLHKPETASGLVVMAPEDGVRLCVVMIEIKR
ncbi:hypothetical protein L6452_32932 [Arctium lappa]|uniref:Uncharacterized protein n=1 Tax=Arctium lappa TaxID=4217 RepID=A0ACB8Z6C2_ARCLA|nr:hypothetical protein L6452_32932 [Arctium lappa]